MIAMQHYNLHASSYFNLLITNIIMHGILHFSVIDRNASNGISNIQSARARNVFEMFVIDFHKFKALNVLTLALTLAIFETEVLKKS